MNQGARSAGTAGADRAVHPVPAGWVSAGPTGAQNYDEFADDAEITAILEANPASVLGVEMPHRTPEAVRAGWGFVEATAHAADRLVALRADGRLRPFADAVAVYRIGDAGYGVFCLVDTDQIAARPGQPGLVVRNEDVFPEKVAQRTALVRTLGTLVSPVLLMQTGCGDELHAFLAALVARLGGPDAADVDQHGRPHAVWLVGPGPDRDRLLDLAGGGELIVADGNHRSLAAQEAGLARFLAVVTTPASVVIAPYHRLLRGDRSPAELVARLRAAGVRLDRVDGPPQVPTAAGTMTLYTGGTTYALTVPAAADPAGGQGSVADRLDHAVAERVLFRGALGLEPGDAAIGYVGGDYPASWCAAEVDAGRAVAALLIPPVTVDDFVAVNRARLKMPRKSTWFTPKARTGLVLADVSDQLTPATAASGPGPGSPGR